MFKASSEA